MLSPALKAPSKLNSLHVPSLKGSMLLGAVKNLREFQGISSRVNDLYTGTLHGEDVVVKFSNRNWDHHKLSNEAAIMQYLGEHHILPVPRIIGIGRARTSAGLPPRLGPHPLYMVMERIDGIPWSTLPLDTPHHTRIVDQAAQHLRALHAIKAEFIGGFSMSAGRPCAGSIYEVAGLIRGPARTRGEYVRYIGESYLKKITHKWSPHELNAVGLDKHLFALTAHLLAESDNWNEDHTNQFPLSHLDFARKNILLDRQGRTIIAVLDWEWAGFAPPEYEFLAGCDFLRNDEEAQKFCALAGIDQRPGPMGDIGNLILSCLFGMLACDEWRCEKVDNTARFLTDKREQATMRAHAVPVSMVMREKADMLRELVTRTENKRNREAYDSKA